ncbi:HEAT repeat domain-containing protein [Erythrobacter oryzae]|uniref:HEAT repeat domain-containing protein n=1 Tax=Erythrobacter oryzae TaxID=3019556 RepID=UPI002554ECE9|nr:HEAT repeat domain-containing protein [Erythrobacter sp. COR-2]
MGLMKAGSRSDFALPDAELAPPSLTDPDPAIRRRAVQGLAADAEGAVETLVWLLRSEADRSVRAAAFSALADCGSLEAAQATAGLLTEDDPALRNGALEALSAMPDAATAMLEPLGHHADPDVRSFAVLLAAGLHRAEACDWLIALAAREDEPNVAAHLAEALGSTGAPGAVAGLEAIRARFAGSAYLAFAIDMALRRLGDG